MYICNNNNCWYTNIGEAFIDIGVKAIISNLSKREQSIKYGGISPMTAFYLPDGYKQNAMNNADFLFPDIIILAGMFASESFCNPSGEFSTLKYVRKLKEQGTKVVFWGLGGCSYSSEEKRSFVKVIDELDPLFIITRDKKTYDTYYDYAECKKGLDCAFWLNDTFDPRGMKHNEYIISTFNRSDEPQEIQDIKAQIIHPWHMPYFLDEKKTRFLAKDNLFVSDSPYEYLTLYANAQAVYTDLVHATIPCLVYGTPVKYWRIDNRRDCFESLEYVAVDSNGFLTINHYELENEKKSIETYIYSKIIGKN